MTPLMAKLAETLDRREKKKASWDWEGEGVGGRHTSISRKGTAVKIRQELAPS